MRRQYHVRSTDRGRLIWDVHRLVALSADLPRRHVALEEIRELDENFWFQEDGVAPTCRVIAEHARLIQDADLRHPIILSADGRIMDGMHRVAKAFIEGRPTVLAVQFGDDPPPDFIDADLDTLPYDDTA